MSFCVYIQAILLKRKERRQEAKKKSDFQERKSLEAAEMDNTYYQGKKAEREAVAFVNQLVEDMGGLKKHLRNLQDKCEVK